MSPILRVLFLLMGALWPVVLSADGVTVGPGCAISWTASTTASVAEYRLYVAIQPGAYDRTTPDARVTAPQTTATCAALGLPGDGQYYLVVTAAIPDVGESDASEEVPFVWEATVTPPGPPDVTPPHIAIRTPQDGASVPPKTTLVIMVDAWDTVGITRLAVTVSGQQLCVLFAPPYQCAWKIPAAKNARYTINAMALDQAGNNAQSQVEVVAR